MKTTLKPLCRLLLLAACLIHCVAFSEESSEKKETIIEKPSFEITQYGIFGTGGRSIRVSGGTDHLVEHVGLITVTNTIQAKLHLSFGIKFQTKNTSEQLVVTSTLTHPPMINPKTGETLIQDRNVLSLPPGRETFHLWSFGEPFELVPGSYIFRVYHKGEKVLEKVFTVQVANEPGKK